MNCDSSTKKTIVMGRLRPVSVSPGGLKDWGVMTPLVRPPVKQWPSIVSGMRFGVEVCISPGVAHPTAIVYNYNKGLDNDQQVHLASAASQVKEVQILISYKAWSRQAVTGNEIPCQNCLILSCILSA